MNKDPNDVKKPHRERLSGRKADKKKEKNKHVQELTAEQRNPKAFAINSAIRAERKFRRSQDLKSKKEHIPLVDRTPLEPPPILVAVVGPPKVGKSTLIRCMLKSYSNQPLTTLKGPVTVVSGKKRRITFIECNNDINSMVDLAKVADLVLLLIDASFGFEMEIFEFLNICQVHGMPKIMGVLTHLDIIKQSKKLQKIKKTLKRRFWTEVYAGAKLFYLSGQVHNEYLRNEVKNLCRFISVMKFRPLSWQTSHSYMLADRIEDITSPEEVRQNSKIDRKVCIYGYMRGIPMNKKSFIHIPGCGDFELSDMYFLPDPCPLPEQLKKRSLIDKERLIYAPFSGVGGIVYDKDAVYVELSHISMKKDEEVKDMVEDLIESKETLDAKLAKSTLQIFSNSKPLLNEEFESINKEAETHETEPLKYKEQVFVGDDGRKRRKVIFEDTDDKNSSAEEDDESDNEEQDIESDGEEEDNESDGEEEDNESDGEEDDVASQSEENDGKSSKTGGKRKSGLEDSSDESEEEIEVKKPKMMETGQIQPVLKGKKKSGDNVLSKKSCNETSGPVKILSSQTEKDKQVKDLVSNVLSELEVREVTKMEACESSSEDSDDDARDIDIGKVPWNDNKSLSSYGESEEESAEDSGVTSDEDNEMENTDERWKANLAQKAADEFLERQTTKKNLWKMVYDDIEAEEDEENDDNDEIGGLFKKVRNDQNNFLKDKDKMNAVDSSKFIRTISRDWSSAEVQMLIKDKFVTGKWKMEDDADELLKLDDLSDDEGDVFGDFEDLETGEKFTSKDKKPDDAKDKRTDDKTSEKDEQTKQELLEKKKQLKEKFDMAYDNKDEETFFDEMKREANRQAELNKSQFEGLDDRLRVELEGFRPGMYVRMEISNVPCELIEHFDPNYPLIAGGLQPQEQNVGYVKGRIKKHRWYNKILKNRDPLIISVGWRRFQTIAVYSKQEDNMRHRMLKYTPEHIACMVHFWGPMMRSGNGFLALKTASSNQTEPGFRIVATGTILDSNQSTVVTKKLKLVGEPMKIFKKTAFIKGMFTSSLEVAKFEGAKIKTVSGIRGQIKKAINDPQGAFRATFEDKILLSDIVFCRTWYRVDIPKLYAPITSLLLPANEKNSWEGMKTVGQLKRERGIHNNAQPDSMYTEIVRKPKKNKPLVLPRAVERDLPYKYKIKKTPQAKQGLPFSKNMKKVVIRNDEESKVASTIFKLRLCYQDKEEKLKKLKHEKMREFIKKKQSDEFRRNQRHKAIKKKIFRALSKANGPPSAV